MDLHTRRMRYFVAVAEELHFGRAAKRLFIAHQGLSKQIRTLESELGTVLLRRSTRMVELTPAGELFLQVCRDVLGQLDGGVPRVQRLGRAEQQVLRLGFVTAAALELTEPILAEFQRRYPDIRLQMREFSLEDPSIGLNDGSSDVALMRLPVSVPDLQKVRLFVEPVVAGVPRGHRLAGRSSVSPEELLDEPLAIGGTDPAWRDFWTLASHRGDQPSPKLVETHSQTEEAELVAAGLACSVTVISAARYMSHPNIVLVPITGHPGCAAAVGWRPGPSAALARMFAAVARDVRDAERDLVRTIEHPSLGGPQSPHFDRQ